MDIHYPQFGLGKINHMDRYSEAFERMLHLRVKDSSKSIYQYLDA